MTWASNLVAARSLAIAIGLLMFSFTAEAAAAEICGNGQDDDADGLADEGCAALTCDSPLSCERWGHTYMTWLDKHTAPDPDQIVVHTNLGQDVLFAFTGSAGGWDTYAPQAGSKSQFQYVRQRVASPHEYQLRLLTGEVLVYSSAGKLAEAWDTVATPNKVLIAHDGNGQVSTVTDASGKRRLAFSYAGGVLTAVRFQIAVAGAWTQQHVTSYGYTNGHLSAVTSGGQIVQTQLYAGGYLTSIRDGAGNTIVSFAYDGAAAGKVVRSDTARGMVGWEYGSSRPSCSGQTVLYFHRGNTASCSADADCGSGFLCGGKTGAGATGVCFRGARCLSVASPSHDVVTSITALGPPGEVCEGACLDAAGYVWNSSPGVLDLGAVEDPSGNYTARSFNANGLPEVISYGDPDHDPTNDNAAREVFLYYGDARFPGRITEIRRKSELAPAAPACSRASSAACARTLYAYDADGKPTQIQQIGYDLDPDGAVRSVTNTITKRYDTRGRLTQIDGPLAGTDDVTELEYWTSSDPFKDGFLQHYKRKKDATTYLTQSSLTFDAWGNATSLIDADGTVSCQLFDAARGYLYQRREAMAGQGDCTPNAADLVTSYTRDSALRLTKLTRPDGSCMLYEYDARGRLAKTRRRDDCLAASAGDREEYTYSDDGLLTKIETFDAAGKATRRQELTYYDSRRLERLLNPVDPTHWTGLTYDVRGLVSELSAMTRGGHLGKTAWTYTADARIETESRYTAITAFDTWNLLFDWTGHQSQVTDGESIATKSVRDDFGRVVKLESPDLGGFPTLRVHDAAGRLETVKEAFGGVGLQRHGFTYDHLGRSLTAQYQGSCLLSGASGPEIERSFDALPAGVACPAGAGCARTAGRLAYVKVSLMCSSSFPDASLDQETFYSYDDAGRVIREYIRDDTGRVAAHQYTWTRNGSLAQVTTPSSAVIGWSHGSASSNSDTDRITAIWRTSPATPIADAIRWEPYGPLAQYHQQSTSGGVGLRTRITRNLAYRITAVHDHEPQTGGAAGHAVTITEDEKGRVIARNYEPSAPALPGLHDSYFLYDLQDRVLCETTVAVASCPPAGSSIKNSHSLPAPFTAAGNWRRLLRPIPGSTGRTHAFTDVSGTHQIAKVSQPDGTPVLGDTVIHHDARGNRNLDDNQSTLTNDDRTYLYDARRNVINVRGQYKTLGGAWHYYDVSSAFDARNRRVFKQFLDETTLQKAQWFFSYDALDRLTEIRHTPDVSSPATYSIFQLFWLGDRLVLYWQTDYPSATTSKRYVGTDESGRPIDMWSWPATGDAARVWAVNPSAWGMDTNLVGPGVFQPILFAGQYQDTETVAFQNDGVTPHRPGVVLNGRRTYDPFTGGYLQPDPKLAKTWVSYVYADGNPVGKSDPTGAMASVKICFSWATERSIGDVDDDGTMDSAIEVIEQCFSQGGGDGGGGGDDTQSGRDGTGPGGGIAGGSWPRPHRHFGTPMELREDVDGNETETTTEGFYCPPVSQLFSGGCWWPANGDTKQQCQECRQHCKEKEDIRPWKQCDWSVFPPNCQTLSPGVPATAAEIDECAAKECTLWCDPELLY